MQHDTVHFRVISALLQYPQQDLIEALPELRQVLSQTSFIADGTLKPLLAHLNGASLIDLQEEYVDTFDRGRKYSLHLFEHIHGESRDRGPAMVDLMEAYKQHGFEIDVSELPDYLPLFLEFLGSVPAEVATSFLDEAVHVIAVVGQRLNEARSPYACAFDALVALASVAPQPLIQPPVRDMDEALEMFGPAADGVEPLLQTSAAQPIQFHPRSAVSH